MKKLIKALENEIFQRHEDFKNEVKELKSVKDAQDSWRMRDRAPKGKDLSKFELNDLKAYLIDRDLKRTQKELNKMLERMEVVNKAEDFKRIVINVEYKRSAMWGMNPRAEARVEMADGTCQHFESGSIGGCGYDKQSTAVANVMNQVNGLLKCMYIAREKDTKNTLREVFGYGAGYGILPRIEGGVGVNCYDTIMQKLGLSFKTLSSGKSFDVFVIE